MTLPKIGHEQDRVVAALENLEVDTAGAQAVSDVSIINF